ncbi:MAG: hypothetical protein RML46_06675 [Anaerolineae bacterium]|nr:hypothetical protein [Anaerolineae bacterium]
MEELVAIGAQMEEIAAQPASGEVPEQLPVEEGGPQGQEAVEGGEGGATEGHPVEPQAGGHPGLAPEEAYGASRPPSHRAPHIASMALADLVYQTDGAPEGVILSFRAAAVVPGGVDYNDRPIAPDAVFTLMYDPQRMPLLWAHNPELQLGHVEVEGARPDGTVRPPVRIRGFVADTRLGRDVAALIRAGSLRTVSLGLVKPEYRGKEIVGGMILEFSLVPTPAQPQALIDDAVIYAVVPYQDWPIYRDRTRPWDRDEAERRIRRWAGRGKDPQQWGRTEWARYRSCHILYDETRPDRLGSYKLLICDVIQGRVYAIPRGIFAAGAVLANPDTYRGRGIDASDEDIMRARRHLARYYRKMREVFRDPSLLPPWEEKAAEEAALILSALNLSL